MKKKTRRKLPTVIKKSHPGAAPGTIVFEKAEAARINLIRYRGEMFDEKPQLSVAELAALITHPPGDAVIWVNVVGLQDPTLLAWMEKQEFFHKLTLEDIHNTVGQRPKFEENQDYCFAVMRYPVWEDGFAARQLAVYFNEGLVITFLEGSCDFLEPLRERLRRNRTSLRQQPGGFLAYAIVDTVIDNFFPLIEKFALKLDEIDERMMVDFTKEDLYKLHRLGSELSVLRRTVWAHRDMIISMIRVYDQRIPGAVPYLRDCQDHTFEQLDVVEMYREAALNLKELFFSSASYRTGEIMRVLTIVSSIFIPLSFIAGLYGMNFNTEVSPYNMPELHWIYGYPFSLGLMGATALGLMVYFYRKRWL